VLGVIAAFTFAADVSDAAERPTRFGQDYQFVAVFGSDGHDFRPNGPVLAALATDPAVAGLTDIRIAATGSGATPVPAHTYKPVGAPVAPILMAGVPPSRDSDLVLAPATASRLGARVGSVVPLTGGPRNAVPGRPGRTGVRAAAGPDSRSPRGTTARRPLAARRKTALAG